MSESVSQPELTGRRVLVAVTGGIACYKSAALVSKLAQAGADVRVIMTPAATQFVGPLTFESLSGRPVLTRIGDTDDQPESQHVGLARWCELMVVVPASADIIGKMAAGLCDDLVSLTVCALPSRTPLLLAPAMNADMWASPIVQRNVLTLIELLSVKVVGPAEGWQACRTRGVGRMSEPEVIFDAVVEYCVKT